VDNEAPSGRTAGSGPGGAPSPAPGAAKDAGPGGSTTARADSTKTR
jgi:hypothetical protein